MKLSDLLEAIRPFSELGWLVADLEREPPVDLVDHLESARAFSLRTFGPGPRPGAVLAHIRKELVEIERNPDDLMEWIDAATLAFDGAMRQGFSPAEVARGLVKKLIINQGREWPDWRTVPADQPIEHIRKPGGGDDA